MNPIPSIILDRLNQPRAAALYPDRMNEYEDQYVSWSREEWPNPNFASAVVRDGFIYFMRSVTYSQDAVITGRPYSGVVSICKLVTA